MRVAAAGRFPDAPLLVRGDGGPWDVTRAQHQQRPFAEIAERIGLKDAKGKKETMYCLRHASIVRALLAGVPARLVAANHDTSVTVLERTYARFISHYGEDAARRGLLAAPSGKVINLPQRRAY
jgi:hypothetical protein